MRCIPYCGIISETLVSDLLKSNCPVTGQPDWGSVQVRYTGQRLDRDALLAYIVSLRRHDVAAERVEVVAGAVQVGRHRRDEVAAVLPAVGLATLDAGGLGPRVTQLG